MFYLALLSLSFAILANAADRFVYAGTYGPGIYAYRFHPDSGEMEALGLVAAAESPSFIAIHPNRRFLYAVNETDDGSVTAYAIDDKTGKLTKLNRVSSRGGGPCHLALDQTGKMLLVANYGTGSVAAFPVLKNGALGEAKGFIQHAGPAAPHAHCVTFSPDNRFAVAADLGLDKLFVYRVDPRAATLAANDPPFAQVKRGSGPRHFVFSQASDRAYAINEKSSTVIGFHYDAQRGALTEFQTISTLPAGFSGENTTAEILADPRGRFLYGSNRGHDSIAVFAVDPATGTLSAVEHVSTMGKVPRNFAIDPTGSYLLAANQTSGNIAVFRIHPETGRLSPTGKVIVVDAPVCIVFR
ncbi:MAG: lactonase family protein [Bryobacteraceae bacterium]